MVTGGSAGIGLEFAQEFSRQGNRVIICGRNPERLASAAKEIGNIETIQCDLAQDTDIRSLVKQVETQFGGVSLLVNNAAIQLNYDFTEAETEKTLHNIDWEIDINLNSVIKLTTLCLPLLRQHSESAVLNISTGLALTPKKGAPIYCATKAGVHIFSKSLRYQMEDAAPNVKIFEAMLPVVDTDMTKGRGTGKISPQQVATEVFQGLRSNNYEIHVGKVKLLVLLNRFVPSLAEKILRNG